MVLSYTITLVNIKAKFLRNIQIKVYHTLLFILLNSYDSLIKQILFIISHFDFSLIFVQN